MKVRKDSDGNEHFDDEERIRSREQLLTSKEFEEVKHALLSTKMVQEVEPDSPHITPFGEWCLQTLAWIDPITYAAAGSDAVQTAARRLAAEDIVVAINKIVSGQN
jgi:hypothetical protein